MKPASALRRILVPLVGLAVTSGAAAQDRPSEPIATMTIGRLHYDGGGDWYANPSSLPNLLQAIATRTGLRVAARERVVPARRRRTLVGAVPAHDRSRQFSPR